MSEADVSAWIAKTDASCDGVSDRRTFEVVLTTSPGYATEPRIGSGTDRSRHGTVAETRAPRTRPVSAPALAGLWPFAPTDPT